MTDAEVAESPQSIAFAEWDAEPTAELLVDPLTTGDIASPERAPDAWDDFLRAARRQAAAAGWTFHDANTARGITLHEGEFLVLAERDGDEFVLQRTDPPSEELFQLTSHDGAPRPVGGGEIADILRRPRRQA